VILITEPKWKYKPQNDLFAVWFSRDSRGRSGCLPRRRKTGYNWLTQGTGNGTRSLSSTGCRSGPSTGPAPTKQFLPSNAGLVAKEKSFKRLHLHTSPHSRSTVTISRTAEPSAMWELLVLLCVPRNRIVSLKKSCNAAFDQEKLS